MAEKVRSCSDEIISPVLNIFQTPPAACGIQSVQWVDYRPVSDINHQGPLEFSISPAGSQYVDLSRTYLYLKLQLWRQHTPIPVDEDVTPVNLTLHSMFSQLDVTLQQKLLYNSGRFYPYKAYIETLMNDFNMSDRPLASEMFYKDTAGGMDSFSTKSAENESPANTNTGLMQRNELVSDGKDFELMGPLHADLCKLGKLLPNGLNIGIKLYRSSTAFSLMTPAKYGDIFNIHISEAVLKVCKVTLEPEIFTAHAAVLSKGITAKYPLQKTEISTYIAQQGATAWAQHDIFQNRIPSLLVVGMVASEAFLGDFKKNPFNFQGFNLSTLTVTRDGQVVPYSPIRMDFDKGMCVEAYTKLVKRMKRVNGAMPQQELTLSEFLNGYALYVYELNDTFYDLECLSHLQVGSLSVEAIFDKPLPENVNIVMFAQFDGLVEIDEFRAVTMS